MKRNPNNLAPQIWARIIRLVQRTGRETAEHLRAHDLTLPQLDVLTKIMSGSGVTQQQIADQLGTTKGNVSQVISRLETDGFVTRSADGASNRLSLTRAGRLVMLAVIPEHDAFITKRLAVLSADEQQQLFLLFEKIEVSLQ